jgi:hypothetical protein
MTIVDWLYAIISLGDAVILLVWGFIDLRSGHRRDALFLMAIGSCGLIAYGIGHYKDNEQSAELAVANSNAATANRSVAEALLKQKSIEADNLKLTLTIEGERKQRLELEKTLQDFKLVAQLSDEALAGSSGSYDRLVNRSREKSELGERSRERVKYIERELAYYEQPPGLVLALELSADVNGKKKRLVEYPTRELFRLLQDETITNNTRFSLINDICQKPAAEVDTYALETLKTSKYLPVIAATTTILRRLHNKARSFLDKSGWIAYLVEHNGPSK